LTDRGRRARLEEIQRVAEAFRGPVDAPDLSSAILARVDDQRCFLSGRARSLVWVGRAGVAVTVALIVLGFTLVHRYSPGTMQVVSQSTPVSSVISTVSTQANEQFNALRVTFDPAPDTGVGVSFILASVAPSSELSQPINAAIHAIRFVGPPEVADAGNGVAFASIGNSASPLHVSRLPRLSQSNWTPEIQREAMEDRRWLEDDSPLMLGTGWIGPAAPK
jgi:hypothetical protein